MVQPASRVIVCLLLAVLLSPSPSHAGEPEGWFGIGVTAPGGGFQDLLLNKTVSTLRITSVAPRSPAEKAGIVAGDEVVAIDGVAVAGRKMREIGPMVRKAVGETRHLLMRRPDGGAYEAVLTGAPRPD